MTSTNALSLLGKKGASLPEILTTALAVPETPGVLTATYDIPKPVIVTAPTTLALRSTMDIEPITITERRALTQVEIDTLHDERVRLDEMEKFIKARKDAHKAMLFNHLDIEIEDAADDDTVLPETDAKGHYVQKGEVLTSGGARFTRELRTEAPVLTAEALRAIEDQLDDSIFSHEDYLDVTTQVRVLDEEKALIKMRTKPEIIEAFSKAAISGKTSAAIYKRK